MNTILGICVPLALRVTAQHTVVLIVELELTPDISKQPTVYNWVHYPPRIESLCKLKSRDLLFSRQSLIEKINLIAFQFNMSYTLKTHQHIN